MNTKPNILLILCDDMGYSDIGCFGGEIDTPNLDTLATSGLRMSSMYNCARCCPSRASLLTGVYPHQAGVGHMIQNMGHPSYQGYLKDDVVTLAEVLKPAGYFTGYSGKWHTGGQWKRADGDQLDWRFDDPAHPTPMSRGFDRFYGNLAGGGSYFNIHLANEQGLLELPEEFYTTDNYTDAAITMMDEAIDSEKPFFVHLCYNAPHWPLHALPEDIVKYTGRYREGWDAVRTARHEELKGLDILSNKWEISPRDEEAPPWADAGNHDWEDARMAAYAAMVDRMDRNIGRAMARLRERGVLDDTLIIFLSDNGGCAEPVGVGPRAMEIQSTPDGVPMKFGNRQDLLPGSADTFMSYDLPWANASNSPFRRFKHWVHEGGISTPFIAHWPNRIRPEGSSGSIRHEACHLVDITATIYDVCGASYPAEYGGKSIMPAEGESFAALFDDKDWTREQPIGFEHEGNCALRESEYKLVRLYDKDWELYDMSADRTELHDLSDRMPERRAQMIGRYEEWAERCEVRPFGEIVSKHRSRR
jgi:arylsulfatase A-like enzyme